MGRLDDYKLKIADFRLIGRNFIVRGFFYYLVIKLTAVLR